MNVNYETIRRDQFGRVECQCCGAWQEYTLCKECMDTLALVVGNITIHGSSSTELTQRQIQYIERHHHYVNVATENGVTFWRRCTYAW